MKRRIGICLTLVLALSLGVGTAQARYLNPATGRFQTMDSYEGSPSDPLSLHKYLYCRNDALNRTDPSGLADYLLFMGYAGTGFNDPEFYAELANSWQFGGAFREHTIHVFEIGRLENVYNSVSCAVEGKHLVPGTDRITKMIIAGHGGPYRGGILGGLWENGDNTSDFTTRKMKDPSSAHGRLLSYLRPFTSGNCVVELWACFEALGPEGRDFMSTMSQALGANVVGYDDQYAIKGWGDQYTASPDGSWKMTKKGKPFNYSWADPATYMAIWEGFVLAGNFGIGF